LSVLRFAIVGGANPEPPSDPPIAVEVANESAKVLGAELARRGHEIIVYDPRYIEGALVAGYVSAAKRRRKPSILVRQPHLEAPILFPEEKTYGYLFERRADTTDQWEVSFYRSLWEADGVILIGGRNSTLSAGQSAIGARIPLLALDRTGGAASTVWKTIAPGLDLPSSDEHARMSHAPPDEIARRWVDDLESQRRRRYAVESGPIRGQAVVSFLLFLLAVTCSLASYLAPFPAELFALRPALLVAAMLLAGGAGGTIRMVFEKRYGTGPLVPPSLAVTLALGTMAGGVAGLLYLVSQPGEVSLVPPGGSRLASIIAIVSFVGGLTADAVFRKLLGIDVVRSREVAAPVAADRPAPGSGSIQPGL
jgi:hypothetical protein